MLIVDLVLPEVDGFEVIERAKELSNETKIIVVSALASEIFIKKATGFGASYYMLKPLSIEVLEKRVKDILFDYDTAKAVAKPEFDKEIEEKITNIFITVGIPAHIKGYQFLRTAIIKAVNDPEIINYVTKSLYPGVAKAHGTTPSRVERAIRHAIEVAWDRGDVDTLNSYFGYTIANNRGKPTPTEFIAIIADDLRLKYGKFN